MNDDFFKQQAAPRQGDSGSRRSLHPEATIDLAERYDRRASRRGRQGSLDRPIPLPTGILNRQKQPEQP
jgi:hypothetical protein